MYFLSQFQTQLIDLFTPFRLSDPILFGVTYTLVFSASKPVGGILVWCCFLDCVERCWQSSSKRLHDYFRVWITVTIHRKSASGIAIKPLSAIRTPNNILRRIGIISGPYRHLFFSLSVANDAEVRRSIRKSVEENSDLLGNIGEAQFEDLLQKEVIQKTRDLSEKMTEETGIATSLEERDIHDYVIMAINEAKRARSSSNN